MHYQHQDGFLFGRIDLGLQLARGDEVAVGMDPLDASQQMRSPDLTGAGPDGLKLDERPEVAAYPQPYSDPSLLQFTGDHGLASPALAFPSPDPSSFQYALTANAIASAQHHRDQQVALQQAASKKDIKRRTKTGCLTCRKRRIKCDETQPACNNCRKSKRECQGYDPLFKNHHSPSLQPSSASVKSDATQQLASSQPAYPAPPAGYAAVQSPTYPLTTMAHIPNEPSTFDFSAAIDPALQNHVSAPINLNPSVGHGSLFASSSDAHQVEVKPTSIEELMQIGAPLDPMVISTVVSEEKKLEIKALFNYYAPGLNKFLETQWFQPHGYSHLLKNQPLLQKYAALLSRMEFTADHHPHENQINLTIEAHIIWGSLELSKLASLGSDYTAQCSTGETRKVSETGGHIDIHETAARFDIIKALITNTHLEPSFIDELSRHDSNVPAGFNALSKQLLVRERNFWKHTAKFLSYHVDTTSLDTVDTTLQDMRGLLESKENRDIMYSVAVMRVWPRRLMDSEQAMRNEGQVIPQLDENDMKKVDVAKTFLTQQAGGRGTTPAVQRVCGMILKGWHKVQSLPFTL